MSNLVIKKRKRNKFEFYEFYVRLFFICSIVILCSSNIAFGQEQANSQITQSQTTNDRFFQDLILVLITLGAGVITSKWITSSWQTKKERNDLKNTILKDLNESLIKLYTLMGIFTDSVFNSYSGFSYDQEGKIKEVNRETVITFSSNPDELPSKKFEKQYKKFIDDYWNVSYAGNRFVTSLLLYFPTSNFADSVGEIHEKIGNAFAFIDRFMHAKHGDDFIKFNKLTDEELKKISTDIHKLALKIMEQKITIR